MLYALIPLLLSLIVIFWLAFEDKRAKEDRIARGGPVDSSVPPSMSRPRRHRNDADEEEYHPGL
jgi:hypothetical protein